MRKRFSQFLDPMSGFEKGPWPVGFCYPLDDACKKLGVTDNLCGKCEADGKGWKLTNMEVQRLYYYTRSTNVLAYEYKSTHTDW
jgi:hypothetical protein